MTAMTALKQIAAEPAPAEAAGGPELDWLLAALQTNRFMPHPPPDSIFGIVQPGRSAEPSLPAR